MNFTNYKKYGKCVELNFSGLKLLVTAEVGPRVIYFGKTENLFFEDLEDGVNLSGEYFNKNFKEGETWHIYGGHRLWKSPEDFSTYAPDNYPPQIEEIENGIKITSAPEKMTGLQKTITITSPLGRGGGVADGVVVSHAFKNISNKPVSASLWAITVLAQGGKLEIPLSKEKTGWLPNRNFVLWDYSDINDPRLTISNEKVTLKQDKNAGSPIKIGLGTPDGVVEYTSARGERFRKTIINSPLGRGDGEAGGVVNLPDWNCNIEAYTSPLIMEAETLSPLYEIAAGETKTHIELWEYFEK